MKIECFLAEGCGSKEQLMQHIEQALRKEGMGGMPLMMKKLIGKMARENKLKVAGVSL